MKLKNFSLLVGAIAFSLTTTPFAVKAETNIKALNQIAQTSKPDPVQPQETTPVRWQIGSAPVGTPVT